MVLQWFGFVYVSPDIIIDHLRQFGYIGGFYKHRRSTQHLFWLSCIWVIWRERNSWILKHKEHSLFKLPDKINLKTFWWLKANYLTFSFNYYSWWLNPKLCLKVIAQFVSFFFLVPFCTLCLSCLLRLTFRRFDGWKWIILLSLLITILGGLINYVWKLLFNLYLSFSFRSLFALCNLLT